MTSMDQPKELRMLDEKPATIDCPFCHTQSVTRVEKKTNPAKA